MADPTQNDENKKPASGGAAKPVSPREEVSAADLLSLWGGGAPSSKPVPKPEPKLEEPEPKPKPRSKPKPKSEPKLELKLEEPEHKLEPKPAPKPEPPPAILFGNKQPQTELQPKVLSPAQEPVPTPLAPKSIPPSPPPLSPESVHAPKIIQPETAFWEIPKQSPPTPTQIQPAEVALSFGNEQPQTALQPKPKIVSPPTLPPEPKPMPPSAPRSVPPPPPAPMPVTPKKEPVIEEQFKPKQKVEIDSDIFEKKEEEEMPPPVIEKKAPKEIFEGEIVASKPLPPSSPEPPSPEEHPQNLNEESDLGSQVDEFLEELNLSRKHIFYGAGCLVLIIILIFGGIWGYKIYKNRTPSEPKPEQQQQQPQTQPQINVPDTSTGVAATQELGKLLDMNLVGSTGVNATSAVGVELTGASGISNYIMTFKRLQNAYETDINELLNQATDRRGRLNGHLALLGKFYVDGTLISFQIQQETDQIKVQYEEKKKVQQTHDSNFFDQIKSLNPQTAENLLADFINVSKEIVVLRARFKALQKVRSYYEFALPKLNARIKDIELNAEALILGLKVYDVKGSDLKLIIPIGSSAGATQNESLESSSGSSLFINPASVSTGHDYIQSPGGGF